MHCKIVNRRGHRLHIYVCSRVGAKEEEILRIRGCECVSSHNVFGTAFGPKDAAYYPQSGTYLKDFGFNHAQTAQYDLPDNGALLWLRNAALVGPWFLTERHDNGWSAPYRTRESRLVILPGLNNSSILLGIDGLLNKIEAQLAGKIRPSLATSVDDDPAGDPNTASGVGFLNYMASALLSAIVTGGTAFGAAGGAASGALMVLIAAATGEGQPLSTRRDGIDMDAMLERFQRLMDDLKARDAATTICAVQQKVEYYGDHFTQLLLRTANFSDVERDLYYDWAYRSIPDTKISELTTLRAKIATQMQTFAPSATDAGEYFKFAEDALDPNTYGNLFWAMDHMLRQPDVRRFALPEFMLGAGLYAVLAPAQIAGDAAKGVSITPATYHEIADKLAAYLDAVKATVDDTIKDMHGAIYGNHLAKIPERIEVLRFFSDRLFDDPDAMRDPKLTVDIPNEQDSFGARYPQYWSSEDLGREIGPVLGAFLSTAEDSIAAFRRAAQALETAQHQPAPT